MTDSSRFQVSWLIFLGVISFALTQVIDSHLLYRITLLVVLGVGGWFLVNSLAVIPGILAISADYIFLMAEGESVTAFDPLNWAFLLIVPYLASLARNRFQERKQENSAPSEKNRGNQVPEGAKQPLPFPGTDTGREEPDYHLQKLITSYFEQAQEKLNFSNLFYFHVFSSKATPGYLINGAGEIDEGTTFTPDVGQGVGWVLRHGERLVLPKNQIDWRNLQYHRQPVDLEKVLVEPIKQGGELIGIIVLEWANQQEVGEDELEDFFKLVREIFIIDSTVRRLSKNQDQLRIMERLYDVNPLGEKNYRRIVQQVLNRVSEFIPAEQVGFYQFREEALAEVTPPARRKIYQQCLDWLNHSEEILKVEDVKNETLSGQALDRHNQTEVGSLLGGLVEGDEQKIGVLLLEHPEPGYFQEEEKRLLKLLLKYFTQTLTVAEHFRQLEADKKKQVQLLSSLDDLPVSEEPEELAEEITRRFNRKLSVEAVAFYWRNNDAFELVSSNGSVEPPEVIHREDTIARRVANSGGNGQLLAFPEARRLEDYEIVSGIRRLHVAPVFVDNKLLGIIIFHSEDDEAIDEETRSTLQRALGLLCDRLQMVCRNRDLHRRSLTDSSTGLPVFKQWRRNLGNELEEEPEDLTSWHLVVPGYEKLCREMPRKKVTGWQKSLARLLEDYLQNKKICRPYGTVFYGFESTGREQINGKLEEVINRMEKMNYPPGEWPEEPFYKLATFSPPYPEVNKIVRAPLYGQDDSGKSQ